MAWEDAWPTVIKAMPIATVIFIFIFFFTARVAVIVSLCVVEPDRMGDAKEKCVHGNKFSPTATHYVIKPKLLVA